MSELYNLIFFPTVKPGEEESEVKEKLSLKLKVDRSKVDTWFASGKPTLLLKEVAPDVADRYMQAIVDCGGNCNMQPSGSDGKGSLSLVPKPAKVELFFCPNCEHEEELPEGEYYEQCPKCDLVLAKWAEHQEEARKKDEIRRRLLRDARFKDDAQSDEQRKRDELAELKRLEAEIMKELGIKPPGRIWQIFSARPISISASLGILLVTLSSVISFYVSAYLNDQASLMVASQPVSEEISAVTPTIVDAVSLKVSGNEAVVKELASATRLMAGQPLEQGDLAIAAEQMMKGAGSSEFLTQANRTAVLKTTTPGALGEPAPMTVNRGTLGGVKGLPGVSELTAPMLARTRPGEVTHGQEAVAEVLTAQLTLPDAENPMGPDIQVDKIERLDGSMVVALLESLSRDLEWDQFLLKQVREFLLDDRPEQASDLAAIIKNPGLKIDALTSIVEQLVMVNRDMDLKPELAGIALELRNIESIDLKARYWLRLGARLERAGVPDQPYAMFSRVQSLADETRDPADRAAVLARLAVAGIDLLSRDEVRQLFNEAMASAAAADSVSRRIEAFSHIAARLYDVRNLTLAGEILSEAQILAATELNRYDRVPVLVSIATTQLYMGDLPGAMQSVRNAARGSARQQLLVQLAAWLINEGDIYSAQALLAQIQDKAGAARLAIRLVSQVTHQGDDIKARALLGEYAPELQRIDDPAERALILSQFARLHLRLRQPDQAEQLFKDAFAELEQVSGRKAAVTRGVIALDQARGLWVTTAKSTMEAVTEPIVAEPVSSEIMATERVIKLLLPDMVREQAQVNRS